MLISHTSGAQTIFRQRPEVYIPTLLLTGKLDGEVIFPEILIIEPTVPIIQPDPNPTTIYRTGVDSVTTLRQGEGWVHVNDLVLGDAVRIWLKSRHYLVVTPLHGVTKLTHKYVGRSGSTNRGYYITSVRGSLGVNDVAGQEFQVYVSPGAHGWPHRISGTAIIPWLAIRRIDVVRRRIDATGVENVRFPLILPVRFPGWLD